MVVGKDQVERLMAASLPQSSLCGIEQEERKGGRICLDHKPSALPSFLFKSNVRGRGSNRFEVPPELPLGDRAFVLACFPVARADVVVDEGGAEDLFRGVALRETLVRLAKR